jgi:hypothetical protein
MCAELLGLRVRGIGPWRCPQFVVRALLYTQGESDGPDEAPAAGARLEELLESLRGSLPGAGGMKLVVGGIAASGERRDTVRSEQAALCARRSADSRYVDNRDLEPAMRAHDSLHYGRQGKLTLGRRMADALIELEGGAAAPGANL